MSEERELYCEKCKKRHPFTKSEPKVRWIGKECQFIIHDTEVKKEAIYSFELTKQGETPKIVNNIIEPDDKLTIIKELQKQVQNLLK